MAPTQQSSVVHSSAITMLQLVGASVCSLLCNIVLARGLGPTGQGAYSLTYGMAVLAMLGFDFGIGAASVYHVSRGTYAARHAAQQNMVLGLSLGGIAVGTVGLALFLGHSVWLPRVDVTSLVISVALIPILLVSSYLNAVLQGTQNFVHYNIAAFTPYVIRLLFTLIGVGMLHGGLHAALLAMLLAHACTLLVIATLLVRRHGLHPTCRIDRDYARTIASYGMPVYASNVLTQLNYRADAFMLNFFTDTASVGLYAVAVGMGERLWMFSFAVGSVILPRISALHTDEATRRDITPRAARCVVWLSAAAAVVVYIVAPWGVDLLFGPPYAQATQALRLLLPGLVIFNISRILGNDIAGRGRPAINAWLSGVVVFVNLAANCAVLPRFGLRGAAAVAAASYTLDACLKLAVYCKLTQVAWTQVVFLQRRDWDFVRTLWQRRRPATERT